ncbi:hypothetical protein [Sphingomonas sp. NIBR02145]|uniref:hypothetical protein n=1 Tax=Sphingomonas sp. NIBR02145 TaxID=3014784 RepID=UPI0022B3AEEF|nr:hypothetical protein [Sphingomonas sp. NIBR02145]WHU03923.1 hypothetical protein O3305_04845 [Sphingomonas sp. NIBR02145]
MIGGAALLLALLFPQTAPPSGGIVIFEPDRARELLSQCSRSVPKPGEGGWTPTVADIARLEAKLPGAFQVAALSPYAYKELVLQSAPKGWIRQYVGIVRGGKRFIYGNFAPASVEQYEPGRGRHPIMVCDGGPGFFGAEYDVEMDAISHLAFNGMA